MADEDNVSLEYLQRKLAQIQRAAEAPLHSGGGGGTFDGMDARVAKLEGQLEKVGGKVDDLRIDMAVLKEKVSHLPGKGFIVTATVTTLALLTAVIVFQDRISAFLTTLK